MQRETIFKGRMSTPPPTESQFVDWFRATLEKRNIAQKTVAEHLDVSPSSVCRLLQGSAPITLAKIVGIAHLLDCTPDQLLRKIEIDCSK